MRNQNPAPVSPLNLAGDVSGNRGAYSPYGDALTLVSQAIRFCSWAFIQVEAGTQGKVCAVVGRQLMLRRGRTVSWPNYWQAWLEQGQVVVIADTRQEAAVPSAPLLQLSRMRSYLLSPVLAADGQLHGILLGYSPARRGRQLSARQRSVLQSASRLLGEIGKLQEQLMTAERNAAVMLEASMRDELTGVTNRRGLEHVLQQEAQRMAVRGHEVTVLFIDLDGLKKVNDEQGHEAGDNLIREAANALTRAARSGDTVGRLGGDELIVVLPRRQSSSALEASVERFAAALHEACIPASIGAASTEETGSVQAAVALADKRMLAHKRKMRRRSPDGQDGAIVLPR